jgi:formylglycine-generating enzyme required for sulfatase activity
MPVLEAAPTRRLLDDLCSARAESDRLFSVLKPEALYQRPIAERHRAIFYLGHLDGFDSIQICREGLGLKSFEPELDKLFQAGIDPEAGHLPTDSASDWPTRERVEAYVKRCREWVDRHLERAPEEVVHMALEHREMHLETLAYMFHNFAHELKFAPPTLEPVAAGSSEQTEWREIPAGEAILGRPHDGSFGWDNEYEETRRKVPAFRMQRFPVTNGEYLEFVKQGAAIPHFWIKSGSDLFYRGMFEDLSLPLDWPVYVTEREAQAYAAWLGKHLATEEEFHRAAFGTPSGENRDSPWEMPARTAETLEGLGNFDFKRWDPESVHATPAGDSAFGLSQLVGNGWEWTRTPFAPFPGFAARASYPGYSANFFDGEHYVLKGGSSRTAARLLRRSFRNWFRRDYPYMYAKFRCVDR